MEHIFDTVIVGGGPAGYSAALYAVRAGLSVLVLERMGAGGQMTLTSDIENYPGFDKGIDGITLGMQMQAGAERFGAETRYAELLSCELEGGTKVLHTTDGDIFARTVILATGANPRHLGLPEEEMFLGRGVHYCAHCDGRFYKDKTVMVIGGGNSAVSDALYLSRMAKKVYLVHRRDTLRASRVYHAPLENAENVECIWDSTLVGIAGDARVSAATVRNLKTGVERTFSLDGVFVSVGREPATAFLPDTLEKDKSGYIVADESTKTNIPGVFAAGDVRTKALRQVVTAAADGAVSAHFAEEYLSERGA